MKNNPIDKIRDLLAEPAARRKAVICAGVVAVLAIGGAGIAIASNRPEPIDSSPSAVEKTETDGDKASGAESVAPRYARRSRSTGRTSARPPTSSPSRPARAASS